MRRLLAALLLVPLGACRAAPLPENALAEQGYRSRPCGFDLNRNGVFGEAADCHVCDGKTADPDGDGVAEDLIYVDCGAGADGPGCGSPASPCRTLAAAWRLADGAADGAEDIVCFRGICPARELLPGGGLPATYAWPRAGSQGRDFRLPRDPAMLVGWDGDGDGAYPPHDPDEVAVLEGAPPAPAPGLEGPPTPGGAYALKVGSAQSHLEVAHFTARDYGRYTDAENSGFVAFGVRGGHRADAIFFHDLRLEAINRDQPAQSHRIVFNYFTSGTRFHHLAFLNLDLAEVGGFMVRGSGPERPGVPEEGGNDGPLRWQNLRVTAHGCDDTDPVCKAGGGGAFIGWKLWGYIDGIEVLDSTFDANVANWQPKVEGNGGALLANATQCSQGWLVAHNHIRDFKVALVAQGGNGGYCDYDTKNTPPRKVPRPTADVVFRDNVFLNTYAPWRLGDVVVHLRGGDDANRSLGNVEIARNVLASTDGFDACVWVDVDNAGAAPPGRILVEDNVCWGSRAQGRATGIQIGRGKMAEFVQQQVILRGNVVAGQDQDDVALRLDYLPASFADPAAFADNLFDRDGALQLRGKKLDDETFAAAAAAEGAKVAPVRCEPAFADPAAGDFARREGDCPRP